MSWRDDWRRQAWEFIIRLNHLARDWGALADKGQVRAAHERRRIAIQIRDWAYWVIDRFLGGIDKLPNKPTGLKVHRQRTAGWSAFDRAWKGYRRAAGLDGLGALGALPQLAIGGAVVVTVATVGAWITNEEERVLEARRRLVAEIGRQAREASDPAVAAELARMGRNIVPLTDVDDGSGLGLKAGLTAAALLGGAWWWWNRRRPLSQAA